MSDWPDVPNSPRANTGKPGARNYREPLRQVAGGVSQQYGLDYTATLQVLYELNVSEADAVIAKWSNPLQLAAMFNSQTARGQFLINEYNLHVPACRRIDCVGGVDIANITQGKPTLAVVRGASLQVTDRATGRVYMGGAFAAQQRSQESISVDNSGNNSGNNNGNNSGNNNKCCSG